MSEMSEDEVIAHLTQVKGIGVWTAHMFLMFTLRRPDILPVGDYGVQAAIKKHYKKRKWPKPGCNAEDRKTVGSLSLDRLLVSVEEPGYQDGRKIDRAAFKFAEKLVFRIRASL